MRVRVKINEEREDVSMSANIGNRNETKKECSQRDVAGMERVHPSFQ